MRLQGVAVWEIVQYLLNALLFVLSGCSSRWSRRARGGLGRALLGLRSVVSATVIALRFAWVFVVLDAPKRLRARARRAGGAPCSSRGPACAARSRSPRRWPSRSHGPGEPFPGRDLILFLTFAVILATLVGQGLTLPLVIRALRLEDDGIEAREDAKARIHAAEAALARLDELVGEEWVREDTAERVRGCTVPDEALPRSARRRRRRGDRDALPGLPAAPPRAARGRARRTRRASSLRRDLNEVWIRVGRDLDLEDNGSTAEPGAAGGGPPTAPWFRRSVRRRLRARRRSRRRRP